MLNPFEDIVCTCDKFVDVDRERGYVTGSITWTSM
jgi:hypothetical protein